MTTLRYKPLFANPTTLVSVPLLFLMLLFSQTSACIHPPREYPGKLQSKIQEYLFFKTGPEIHMIMNQRIQSDLDFPKDLAWVTPLPTVPKGYFQEKDSVFKILFQATEQRTRGVTEGKLLSKGFIAHDTVHVGEYEIIPLEFVDVQSGTEINQWLEKNGYAKVPLAGLRYYLKPKACFLAIKVRGMKGKERTLHPLHVVFKADAVRVPLKFFANAGTFEVFVYIKLPANMNIKQKSLEKSGIKYDGHGPVLGSLVQNLGIKGLVADSGSIERYHGEQINTTKSRLEDWKEDPLILFN